MDAPGDGRFGVLAAMAARPKLLANTANGHSAARLVEEKRAVGCGT